ELPGKRRLAERAPRHPDVQAVLAAHIARHVRAERAHAEPWHRGALHSQERRAREFPGDGISLFAPQALEVALLAELEQEGAHRRRSLFRRVERGIEMPRPVAMAEELGSRRQDVGEIAMDETRALRPDEPWLELGKVCVVAALDMVE